MRRVAAVAALALAISAGTAQAVGNTPGTFMRDNAGGYFDACHIVRVVPLQQTFYTDPVTRVTLDTGERITLDPTEGGPYAVVAAVAALTCNG